MWFEKTFFCTGVLCLVGACSSSADVPTPASSGRTGGRTGAGASSSASGATSGENNAAGASNTGQGGSGEDTGSGGSGESPIGGASSASGGAGQTGVGGASTSTATGGSNGGACVAQQYGTQPVPPILQFVIDKSTSMNTVIGSTNGRTKWQATRDALKTAYAAMSANFAVGENFFPNANGGCVDTSGGVMPAPLTAAQLTALDSAIDAVPDPTNITGTPTHDAWIEGLRRLQATLANPPPGYEGSIGYIVLVTDGMPVRTLNCGQADGDNIAVTEAQFDVFIDDVRSATAETGIQTFVIGVPGSEDTSQVPTDPSGSGIDYVPREKLSELAQAGNTASAGCDDSGTPIYCHFDMVDAPDFVTGLVQALASISTQLISCSYTVPPPPTGEMFDPRVIDVTYTTGTGEVRPLTQAGSAACEDGQWYVAAADSVGIPTQLQLCPTTCDTVSGDPGAEMSVAFRCIIQQ